MKKYRAGSTIFSGFSPGPQTLVLDRFGTSDALQKVNGTTLHINIANKTETLISNNYNNSKIHLPHVGFYIQIWFVCLFCIDRLRRLAMRCVVK